MLECVMCAALSYVKKEMLQEANDVGGINVDLFLLIIALQYRWLPVAPFRFPFSLLGSETVFFSCVTGSYFVSQTSPISSFHGLGHVAWKNCSP